MRFSDRKDTRLIFIHCSATQPKQDIGVLEINKWHLQKGWTSDRGLSGYHFVIRRNGIIELGRDMPAIGAQVQGFNSHSLGVCLIGGVRKAKDGEAAGPDGMVPEDNFTPEQMASLEALVRVLKLIYPVPIAPHNLVAKKACPSFDVWKWQTARFGYSDEEEARRVVAELQKAIV